MKLKVKPILKNPQPSRNSYLNSSSISSLNSSMNSIRMDKSYSKPKCESRFDKIMKLKTQKPKVNSTLKNYQPTKNDKKILKI